MPFYRCSRLGLATLTLWVACLSGCGGGARIEGTVTLDGQPVDGGTIALIPTGSAGKGGSNEGGPIKNGKYLLDPSVRSLAPGTYKVEINWFKKTGKSIPSKNDPGTTVDEVQQVIPMEYNSSSKLTTELKAGSNTANFELKSGGPISNAQPGSRPNKTKAVGDN